MTSLLNDKLEKAAKSFSEWKKISFEDKQKYLHKLSTLYKEQKEMLAHIITDEMNKPITEAIAEIEKCALMITYYAEAENVLKPEKIKTEYDISEIHFMPLGVILGVMPWNFPFWQAMRFIIPAILAGNVTVLKHASICFGTGNAIEKLFLEAGFPEGVFQNLEIGHEEVKELLANRHIKAVSLTGSGSAGSEVAANAGKNIKKSLLELGGNDAFIVLDDADLEIAAKKGAKARLANCGQACNASKRFIILKDVYDKFLELFIKEYKTYQPGDPRLKETKIAGMAKPELADKLEQQYEKAIKNGAEVILPLERISEIELQPGLIKVQVGNPILEEEVFGPLGIVMKATNPENALQIANSTPFGLSNVVWTKDRKQQKYFLENLESGTVSINKVSSSDPRLPFGGAKESGYGTELSLLALKEFVTIKTVIGNH